MNTQTAATRCLLVDIGVNLNHRTFRKHWRDVVERAVSCGVENMLLTGTSLRTSRACIEMANQWHQETNKHNLYATVGVHPHDAKLFQSTEILRKIIQENPSIVVAVGECGLDYNRNFSSKQDQLRAFREQVLLACELQLPLFLHEREAHADLLAVLDEVQQIDTISPLPPIVVHCFTGTKLEAEEYIRRGYYIGFTGTICKKDRGAPLREILPILPLNRIMLETDAPFMGFRKGRRHSEPADVAGVAEKVAEVVGVSFKEVCRMTTLNAKQFFRLVDEDQES